MDVTDQTLFPSGSPGIGASGYMTDFDLTFDGQNDFSDVTAWLVKANAHGTALPDGWVGDPSDSSGPDNSIGYSGYRFNAEAENYEVRNRVYLPVLGRWAQRDPIRFIDGMNLYQAVQSNPVTLVDPLGLSPSLDDQIDPNDPIANQAGAGVVQEYNRLTRVFAINDKPKNKGQLEAKRKALKQQIDRAGRGVAAHRGDGGGAGAIDTAGECSDALDDMVEAAAKECASAVRDSYGPGAVAMALLPIRGIRGKGQPITSANPNKTARELFHDARQGGTVTYCRTRGGGRMARATRPDGNRVIYRPSSEDGTPVVEIHSPDGKMLDKAHVNPVP